MDVLSPDLMWIDGRCYRIPVLDSIHSNRDSGKVRDQDLENEPEDIDNYEEYGDDEPEITSLSHGKYKMVFPVSRSFLPFIIGSKGATIKRVSKDTSCIVTTPRLTEEQNITITGPSKDKVILAWKNICFIMKSSRKKLNVTHFMSLPLISDEIKDNFIKFKKLVLETCKDRGIIEEIFNDPGKLHITLALFVLTDDKERKEAAKKFREICDTVVKPMLKSMKPCLLEMKGLNYMNDDPYRVSVLYSNVKIIGDDGLLQELCDKILHALDGFDLLKEENRTSLKIHATLMNTSYLKRDEMNSDDNVIRPQFNKKKENFNASNIIQKYRDYYFGKAELKTLYLSINSTINEAGYYKHLDVMEL